MALKTREELLEMHSRDLVEYLGFNRDWFDLVMGVRTNKTFLSSKEIRATIRDDLLKNAGPLELILRGVKE